MTFQPFHPVQASLNPTVFFASFDKHNFYNYVDSRGEGGREIERNLRQRKNWNISCSSFIPVNNPLLQEFHPPFSGVS